MNSEIFVDALSGNYFDLGQENRPISQIRQIPTEQHIVRICDFDGTCAYAIFSNDFLSLALAAQSL